MAEPVIEPIKYLAPLARPTKAVAGKTGAWRWQKPVVDSSKCVKCYQCEIFCPDSAVTVDPERGAVVDYEYCKGCGLCAEMCPVKAIKMVPEEGG